MSSFNDSLENCLEKLYDYSSNFDINIELIQKLAQQLKLDTFVDKDAYSHIFEPTVKNSDKTPSKFQRLSIAGSFILIDIDFTELNRIINISLSLANHINNTDVNIPDFDLNSHIKIADKDEQGNIPVNIDYADNGLTFLTKGSKEGESSAEEIILSSLQSDKLGKFPFNLKFLATLDRLSSTNEDLFLYLDKTALILQTVYFIETKQNSDWLYTEGLSSRVGKISINDLDNSQLGIFIDFWRDFRYLNHELATTDSDKLFIGNSYKALLNVKATDSTQKDYLVQNKDSIWKLGGKDREIESYKLIFNNDTQAEPYSTTSLKSFNKNNTNWVLSLDLNYPIFIPLQALEFYGVPGYEKVNDETIDSDLFNRLNDKQEYNFNLNINKESSSKLHITQRVSQEYIPVNSIALNSLGDLAELIPVLRNFIALANILRTLIKETSNNPSLFGSLNKTDKLSVEAKNRLKASLKLPDDVTDEELMGLSAVSDNTAFSTAQINKPNIVDLNYFMNDDLNESEKIHSSIEDLQILFSIDDIDYCSPSYDLLISMDGLLPATSGEMVEFEIKFKIMNGVVSQINPENDDGVNMDEDNEQIKKNKRFIAGLNLTEDIIKVLQYVYLD